MTERIPEALLDQHDRRIIALWSGQDVPASGDVELFLRDKADAESLRILLKVLNK